jgi:hypothetical protein
MLEGTGFSDRPVPEVQKKSSHFCIGRVSVTIPDLDVSIFLIQVSALEDVRGNGITGTSILNLGEWFTPRLSRN